MMESHRSIHGGWCWCWHRLRASRRGSGVAIVIVPLLLCILLAIRSFFIGYFDTRGLVIGSSCMEASSEIKNQCDKGQSIINGSNGALFSLSSVADGSITKNDETKEISNYADDPKVEDGVSRFPGFKPKWNSPVRFVFLMGLEGTGHHLMNSVIKGSPMKSKWKMIGFNSLLSLPNYFRLRMNIQSKGVMVHHCLFDKTPNPANEMKKVVNAMAGANLKAENVIAANSEYNNNTDNKKEDENSVINIPFPIMSSYPSRKEECRKLQYPIVDMIYEACDEAKVDCGHIYLVRDPLEILRSTTIKRHFNEGPLDAMHLYTSMLKIMIVDMTIHSDRTLGCFNFFESNVTSWWDTMRLLWGWKDETQYKRYMSKIYHAPTGGSNSTKVDEMNDPRFKPYLDAYVRMHKHAETLCKKNLNRLY